MVKCPSGMWQMGDVKTVANSLSNQKFYRLMFRVYAKDKNARIEVVREFQYYNVKVIYEGGSEYICGPEYTYNPLFAEEKRQRYQFLTRGMLI